MIHIPALIEPHAHLDKAFLAERVPNETGDLHGAIAAMHAARSSISVADTIERAERAARLMAANGVIAVRTHVDVTTGNGLTSVEALAEVQRRVAAEITVQIVALAGFPITGAQGAAQRELLDAAMSAGADLVGGCPHLDPDPAVALDLLLEVASRRGTPIDLHVDENLDPSSSDLERLASRVLGTGFAHRVTASHAVALAMKPLAEQERIAALVAEAGIGVVALPATNLYLQGRDHPQAMPRAVTAVGVLRRAGVLVAAGGDNLRDPFHPLGNGDPLEIAALMVLTAHLSPEEALATVSREAQALLGIESEATVEVDAMTVAEAIARRPAARRVVHA